MKPILFNTEMVCGLLDGTKTVTRRTVKPQPKFAMTTSAGLLISDSPITIEGGIVKAKLGGVTAWNKLPYRPGGILYVRETWCRFDCSCCEGDTITGECLADNEPDEKNGCWMYRASNTICGDAKWRPSIHMPREAARIFLRVTDVRMEKLQDISPVKIREEGLPFDLKQPVGSWQRFIDLWDSTIKPADRALYGWDANPWVWVIKFARISKEEALRDA